MKAIVHERYGAPEGLELREVDRPTMASDEVLIRVHAASVSASDWEVVRGKPLYARLNGMFTPKHAIPGSDVAGRVEAVGDAVTSFRPGDEVFGDTMWHGAGAFAEYVSVPEEAPLVRKPPELSFEVAATLPQAGVIALQGLEPEGGVGPGDEVLVNGAGGGAGTFAVQMAKARGAEVTGVDNGLKLDLLRALGADHVIDHTAEDFTRLGRRYDLVLDLAAHRSVVAYRRSLEAGGRCAVVGGSMNAVLQAAALGPLISRIGGKSIEVLAVKPNKRDLVRLVGLIAAGVIEPVIDRTYSLAEVPDAIRDLGEGRVLGKAVIVIASTRR